MVGETRHHRRLRSRPYRQGQNRYGMNLRRTWLNQLRRLLYLLTFKTSQIKTAIDSGKIFTGIFPSL